MLKSILSRIWLCYVLGVLFLQAGCWTVPQKSSIQLRLRRITFLSSSPVEALQSNDVAGAGVEGCGCPPALQEGLADSPLFFVDPSAQLTERELSNENMLLIVTLVASDRQCNALAWKCLGYTYHAHNQSYTNEGVFQSFRTRFLEPPDVIGVTRDYSFEVDRVVRDASMHLMRSVPPDFKGGVRSSLRPLGFRGYQLKDLTPNKTRRAQLVNWLIFFRETFFAGRAVARREEEVEGDAPLLPSEQMFRTHRLDQ